MADSPFNIVTSSKPKKGSKGIIVAVIVVAFLIISVIAGVLLVRQRQNIQEKAQVTTPSNAAVTFTKAGRVRVYYMDLMHTNIVHSLKVTFTGVGQPTTVEVPAGVPVSPAKMKVLDTTYQVSAGDRVTIQTYHDSILTKPGIGWESANAAGKCGPSLIDVSAMITWATSNSQGEPLVSKQCWGDYIDSGGSNTDYNDYFVILSYVPAAQSPSPSPSVSPSPTGSSSPGVTLTPTPTSTSSAQRTPRPIPETGVDWPSMAGIGVGAVAIILAILLAL
jgi:hypothetical protein